MNLALVFASIALVISLFLYHNLWFKPRKMEQERATRHEQLESYADREYPPALMKVLWDNYRDSDTGDVSLPPDAEELFSHMYTYGTFNQLRNTLITGKGLFVAPGAPGCSGVVYMAYFDGPARTHFTVAPHDSYIHGTIVE